MKKNARIIQISGFRGIVMVLFIGACLIAGFVGFPAIVAMYGWNYLASLANIPPINMLQGLLLWGFFAGSIYLLNDSKKFVTAFKAPTELSDEELKKVLEKVRTQSQARILNSMVLKAAELKKLEKNINNESSEKLEPKQSPIEESKK